MQNIGQVLQKDPLVALVQKESFVGWVYAIDYDRALVMTNDIWKTQALGVPHNCFLLAGTFDPEEFEKVPPGERELTLLRVVGTSKLPQDDDLVRAKIDHFQSQKGVYVRDGGRDYDDITRSQMQFHGLECRVLGCFFMRDGRLQLGSDVESFTVAARLNVYRPRGAALRTIANYVDPLRQAKANEEALALGITHQIEPFQIGTVRYTSTDRLHRGGGDELVPVSIQPSDFLARRTAVLGMTRTGKSNMVKQTVAVVKRVADEGGIKIGQIVYDMNGEYANANQQDQGSLADVFPADTVRYRMLPTPGFRELLNNFYEQPLEGFAIIRREIEGGGRVSGDYVRAFLNMSLDEPDRRQEPAEWSRWAVRIAAYRTVLWKAGFKEPQGYTVKFSANAGVQAAVNAAAGKTFNDPNTGLSLKEAAAWFDAVRQANANAALMSSSGGPWVDDTLRILLDMMAQRGQTGTFISGYRILADIVKYHTPNRSTEVADEIYALLADGKIVILDLSVGEPTLRDKVSKQVAKRIFDESMKTFVAGRVPPNIVVYIEEAHNLIGKDLDLIDTWPRLAKEGAKYRIGLVYATQEVSSVHPNILANTENWFISHLNNEREIKELARFYDFADFSKSLMRAQDVGFTRVKTLSSPFVIPCQIDKFDPQQERERVSASSKDSLQARAARPKAAK